MNTKSSNQSTDLSLHQEMMSNLSARHEELLPLLAGNQIHYLDIPMYGNVGDLLIMLGTLRFIEKNLLQVSRLGMYFNYSPAWAKKGDVILFQGGGNFGDIYGPFQKFREKVVEALPDNRIVILPQTIHFSDSENYRRCCDLLSQHTDLHICVRDTRSEDLAQLMTPHVYLLPDMAHQLWPIGRSSVPDRKVMQLRRRDGEAQGNIANTAETFDWDDLIGKEWRFFLAQIAERSMYHATRFQLNKPFANMEARLWIAQAQRFVNQAIALFSRYERIESDRLHAHILASLLSIPNRIGDNSYGKNGNYISAWTAASELVELVDTHALFSH